MTTTKRFNESSEPGTRLWLAGFLGHNDFGPVTAGKVWKEIVNLWGEKWFDEMPRPAQENVVRAVLAGRPAGPTVSQPDDPFEGLT